MKGQLLFGIIALALLVVCGARGTAARPAQSFGYELVDVWQSDAEPPGSALLDPVDVSWAGGDSYLVTDRGLHRVVRVNRSGAVEAVYGRPGDEPGELYQPLGAVTNAASSDDADVYVADAGNGRISVFAADGTPARQWLLAGKPLAVARIPDAEQTRRNVGTVAVVREEPPRNPSAAPLLYLTTFTPEGKFVSDCLLGDSIGAPAAFVIPSGPYEPDLTDPVWYLVVNQQLHAFGISHACVSRVPAGGTPGVTELADAALDARGEHTWWYVTLPGKIKREGSFGARDHYTSSPGAVRALALGPDGTAVVAMRLATQRFGGLYTMSDYPDREPEWFFGEPVAQLGWLGRTQRLAVVPDGSAYAGDDIDRVQRIVGTGAAQGQAELPGHVGFDATAGGDIFALRVLDRSSDEDPRDPEKPPPGMRRTVLARYGFGGPLASGRLELLAGQVQWRATLAEEPASGVGARFVAVVDSPRDGRVYALDAGGAAIVTLTEDGADPQLWPLPSRAGRPGYVDLAAAPGGGVAVLHSATDSLLWLAGGTVTATWTVPDGSYRVTIAPDGVVNLATSDGALHAYAAGGPLASWPSYSATGPEPPSDIAAGPGGRLYEADFARAAIAVYERVGVPPPQPTTAPTPSSRTMVLLPAVRVAR